MARARARGSAGHVKTGPAAWSSNRSQAAGWADTENPTSLRSSICQLFSLPAMPVEGTDAALLASAAPRWPLTLTNETGTGRAANVAKRVKESSSCSTPRLTVQAECSEHRPRCHRIGNLDCAGFNPLVEARASPPLGPPPTWFKRRRLSALDAAPRVGC
ncbi:hypothetical protein BGZ61DRAFT_443357 [Ilyonectria robusta]|uniref:uncharacterized protein n=1 Tax=Ilyonectria robusta TaxID=1079257 RepID=UPI001E8DAA2A|nr:uncharacterized protein BGZ61DRAFT_443357 [Ilyonectria robusta]KAH8734904.1 hypothetical protein BGZ61DRAFT_443357 [Ilyonectria robusta]